MSYLSPLRLHFSGRFQANVSTVNNDPAHFDNAAFEPGYQAPQGPGMHPPNGWFNPQGDAAWRLLGCTVNAAWTPSGQVTAPDPVLCCIVADSDSRVPAKLVDLDSEQQLVSEIWGLQVRIAQADGTTLLTGDFDPAAFIDIWDRSTDSAGGDTVAGAMYQSVLDNLQWADVSESPFLTALKVAAGDGLLSIKFNVDTFNMDPTSPEFMTGRIVGSIGPASLSEPRHMVLGRQFMAAGVTLPTTNFFTPANGINFCVGVIDRTTGCIYVDMGNALTTGAGGAINDQGDLTLGIYNPLLTPVDPAGSVIPIGVVSSQGPGGYASDPAWYTRTAGIVAMPIPASLMALAETSVLGLVGASGSSISESPSGAFLRADTFVYRLSPGDTVSVPVRAMQWGRPLQGVAVDFLFDPSQLQPGSGFPYVATSPPVAQPLQALDFGARAVTDANGIAQLVVRAGDPGTPRWFNGGLDYGIDGQVYGVRAAFEDSTRFGGPVNQWNFISFLVWSGFAPASPVTWTDLQPIFQQYANLYPVMNRFLDLGDYDSVVANARLLSLAFGLNPDDPNAMPVTRDLSPAKRDAILAWLKQPLPGAVAPVPERQASAVAPPPEPPVGGAPRGGKAAAASRRLVLQGEKS